jgi:hypothetical protein
VPLTVGLVALLEAHLDRTRAIITDFGGLSQARAGGQRVDSVVGVLGRAVDRLFFFQPLVGEVVMDDSEGGEGGTVSGRGVRGADGPVMACAVEFDDPPAAVEVVGNRWSG